MNNKEALSILHCPDTVGGLYSEKYGQALEVAFRCMEACEGSMTVEEYRQRMIQAFHNADCDELIAVVCLPTEKEFEHLEWLLQTHYKKEPCEDCISRQSVIEQLNVYCKNNCRYTEAEQEVMCRACDIGSCIELIEDMPPVTLARPRGKWEYVQYDRQSIGNYHCSLCGCIGEPTNFCPNCGAKMVEPQESEGKE